MKFYIASSFTNIHTVKLLSNRFKSVGHVQTYDWTQNEKADSDEQLSIIGEKEKKAVEHSDFLVMILPAGKGSHIEFGIALGLGKRMYLYAANEEMFAIEKSSTFYHIESVNRFIGTLDSFTSYVIEKEECSSRTHQPLS